MTTPSAEAMERVLSTIRPFWQQMYGYPPTIVPALAAALDAFAAEAIAAYRQSLEDEWQPIETAPKDRTYVLLYFAPTPEESSLNRVAVGCRSDFGGWILDALVVTGLGREKLATHWRPLPAPPADAK